MRNGNKKVNFVYIELSEINLEPKSTLFKKLTPLTGLAFAFILAGIVFGDDRLIGYSLIGVGAIFAIIDIFKKNKEQVKAPDLLKPLGWDILC